ncbi:MAG TPA: hypothetical protein VF791_06735 [Pyrinomonadaceae bacterium]
MSRDYWKDALKTAQEQAEELRTRLNALDAEREEIVNGIVQLEEAIKSLSPLASERPLEKINAFLIENATELNLADACREVLKKNDRYMTPIEIRNTLDASNFDLTNYSNPLASIHGVLKRMADSGEIEKHEKDNTTLYRFKRHTVTIPASGGGSTGRSAVERMVEGEMKAIQRVAEQLDNPTMRAAQRIAEQMDTPMMRAAQRAMEDWKKFM